MSSDSSRWERADDGRCNIPRPAAQLAGPIASCVFRVHSKQITAVMLHMEGRTLRVLPKRFAVGSIVKTGAIVDRHTGDLQLKAKYWRVLGHSTWREARKIANLTLDRGKSLEPGIWHVVVSD